MKYVRTFTLAAGMAVISGLAVSYSQAQQRPKPEQVLRHDKLEVTVPDFPAEGLILDIGGGSDAFVAKVNLSGSALNYCGYIGGSNGDSGSGIAVDSEGNAYVTGIAASPEATFPAIVGPDLTFNGGTYDVFVAKISYWDLWTSKLAVGDFDGDGTDEVAVDFGANGIYLYDNGAWTQLSGVNVDYVTVANVDRGGGDEIFGDFGATGLWHCEGGLWTGPSFTWTILSGVNADFMIRADVDGNGTDEVVTDFGTLGLWLWNAGAWTQASGVNPEYHMAADLDGDNKDEIMADFGALGVWLWNEGTWSQISANNPD